ncbi:hypothetical protein NS220_13900 [Microbacterium testaceum]|uniref:Uncharacterized protein n=1 Tax=Microbacterium testaceum TaxID=2033 RepID=A0A147EUR2_MICTE|nr:hypothetical protein [Microbacterium testaceum]KTR92931.1 hypothetical protein NS220_13900 [Microbacterium testaceum]
MKSRSSLPLGAVLSAAAAFVFATPTLFLAPDAHASVKLVFIVGGSVLFAAGVIRIRSEGRTGDGPASEHTRPEDVTLE